MFFDKLAKRCRSNIVVNLFGSYYTVVITSVDYVRKPMVSMVTASGICMGIRTGAPGVSPTLQPEVV